MGRTWTHQTDLRVKLCSFGLAYMLKETAARGKLIQIFIISFHFPDKCVYDRLWEMAAIIVIDECQCWEADVSSSHQYVYNIVILVYTYIPSTIICLFF